MKRNVLWIWLTALALIMGSMGLSGAEIIPPRGEGQIGLQAVVLCEELSVRDAPQATAPAVGKLLYGTQIIIQKEADGWARCFLSDSEGAGPAGWVKTDYLAIDPAWYRTEGQTPVYAWNDTAAPRVALLEKDTLLPVLKQEGDWLTVSLRGAAGWIRDAESAKASPIVLSGTGIRDGERFEEVVILEGTEEAVRLEHIRSEAIGFEMDYEYETLARSSDAERERFVSVFDDPKQPENYIEVTRSEESVGAVLEALRAELSRDGGVTVKALTLARAEAMCIETSSASGTPGRLMTVYIIPAAEGCLVAAAHYTTESAEGWGRRFSYMMNTLAVIGVR